MPAVTATATAILKEYYSAGGVQEQINYESLVLNLCMEHEEKWEGSALIVPLHVSVNNSPTEVTGAGTAVAPAAGEQGYVRYVIDAAVTVASCGFEEIVVRRSGTDRGAFERVAKEETDKLVKDVKNRINRMLISGGSIKGLLNEHKASALTAGNATWANADAGVNVATTVWEFNGDFNRFLGVAQATSSTWLRVNIIRLDSAPPLDGALPGVALGWSRQTAANGTLVLNAGAVDADVAIFVSAINRALRTVSLTVMQRANFVGAGSGITTVPVQAGSSIALEINATTFTDSAAAAQPAGTGLTAVAAVALEQNGFLHNLYAPTIYGVARTSAAVVVAANNTVLQSTAFTNATAGAHARAALDRVRIQSVLDQIALYGDDQVDCLLANDSFRARYYAILTATTSWFLPTEGVPERGDIGVKDKKAGTKTTNYSFADIPMFFSKDVPPGLIFFHKKDAWRYAPLGGDGDWLNAGKDHELYNPIDPATGRPVLAYMRTWMQPWNLYCRTPNKIGTLCGYTV